MSEATQKITMARALNQALHDALSADDRTLLMGEDIGALGGVFRITDGLLDVFGPTRVVDAPLAESGIVGTAVGLAMRGYRPVLEMQFDGFVFPAYDQIISQVAKLPARSEGRYRMPIVIRLPFAGGIGAVEHHSESPETLFVHIAGIRVVSPSHPQDAYTLMRQAISSDDPVVFLEPKRRYWEKGEVTFSTPDVVPAQPRMDQAVVARTGQDVTLVSYGPTVRTCLDAAQAAAAEGIDIEVIDLRSLSPMDVATVAASVNRTGRLVIAHEAPVFGGLGGELAARISQECFYRLQAPVLRVGGFHMPYPPARLEKHYIPDLDRVLDAVDRSLAY